MSKKYEDAERLFFEELGFPEPATIKNYLAQHIERMHDTFKKLVESATEMPKPIKRLCDALQKAMHYAEEGYQTASGPKGEELFQKKFLQWKALLDGLLTDAQESADFADIYLKQISGGARKRRHFEEKLEYDLAFVAADNIVKILYDNGQAKCKRRLYHGAGLLHYLGFPVHPALNAKEPFPPQLKKDDRFQNSILDAYRKRLKTAKVYLSQDALDHLLSPEVNEKVQKELQTRRRDRLKAGEEMSA